MKKVIIYSTPVCGYCKMAKEFFKENNIGYEEINVAASDEKRQELMDKSGQLGVPVIFVDNDMVIGFDKKKLISLLNIGAEMPKAA